uniref:RNA-directed DNA polymerase n=1 Tax=Lutzomyia longipalpis TaxID=7200 RepID=A0A1B0CTV6_LUTLO
MKVKYVKGTNIPVADTLSRDCNSDSYDEDGDDLEIHSITCLTEEALTRYQLATANDPVLRVLIKYILSGWPDNIEEVPKAIRNCFTFRDELSFLDGLVFKGDRVYVPQEERSRVLKDIHHGHYGIQTSLRRAREFLFWPGMVANITQLIEECKTCEKYQRSNQKECVFMKRVPELPFEMIATDLFTYKGKEYILLVDSYSGYFDFKELRKTTSSSVIKFLKDKFSEHGIPLEVHSDGGPQYSSSEFKKFAREWNFVHRTSSPYFARSNGLAERYVQTAKRLLKKCTEDKQDIKMALLLARNTPGLELRSPAERLFNRKTRNPLCVNKNLLAPRVIKGNSEQLKEAREEQKRHADKGARLYEKLAIGERVRVQERDKTWSTGTVSEQRSDRSYAVEMDDGRTVWRNRHFIHPTKVQTPIMPPCLPRSMPTMDICNEDILMDSNDALNNTIPSQETTPEVHSPSAPPSQPQTVAAATEGSSSFYTTRSGRISRPPDRLNYHN